jgi:hypothetical protein
MLNWCRAVTTGPNSGIEVFAPGRQDSQVEQSCYQERQPPFVAPLFSSFGGVLPKMPLWVLFSRYILPDEKTAALRELTRSGGSDPPG